MRLFATLQVDPRLVRPHGPDVLRAEMVQALMMLLFEDMLRGLPTDALAYIREAVRTGHKIILDHSALRTARASGGSFPQGVDSFSRILIALGYECGEAYPLPSRLVGYRYTHVDCPDGIAQMFLSELELEKFSAASQQAMQRVLASSIDPLPVESLQSLETIARKERLAFDAAVSLLPNLAACFTRQHDETSLADYELLERESQELAWFATEGTILNHFASRVSDVRQVHAEQKRIDRAMKDGIEFSPSGLLAQTSFRSSMVERLFVTATGSLVHRQVPGAFWELITRSTDESGNFHLKFDVGNAQSILSTMTER